MLKKSKWQFFLNVLALLAISLACTLLLWQKRIFPAKFEIGEKSPSRLVSTQEISIIDQSQTTQKNLSRKQEELEKFLQKPSLLRASSADSEKLERFKGDLQKLRALSPHQCPLTERDLYKKHPSLCLSGINPKSADLALRIAPSLLERGFLGSLDLQSLQASLKLDLAAENLALQDLLLVKDLLEKLLPPNLSINKTDLQNRLNKIEMMIEPVWVSMPARSIILERGELVTAEKYALIESLDLNVSGFDLEQFRDAILITTFFFLLFAVYLRAFEKLAFRNRELALISLILLTASALVGLFPLEKVAFLPIAIVGVSVALFFRPAVGFFAGLIFGLLCLFALETSPIFIIPGITGTAIGALLTKKARNRADLAKAGPWIALAQMLSFLVAALVSKNISLFKFEEVLLYGLDGVFTALFISGIMPFLESLFGIVTRFRLLELSDYSNPLLQRLHDDAPGTYEHTLVVADLAVDAAKSIQANHELVRVGVLYHDIGKLYWPCLFIENQFEGKNPHLSLSPLESAKALIRHVPEGLSLGKQYNLPEPILNFIPTHQGTARTGHFFLKAKQNDPSLVSDSEFRYPGPRPNSKETGIAMLADSVEATIRSLKTGDHDLVRKTICSLIEARIEDKQLVESSLSAEELALISESFFESWKNKNHERIAYQKERNFSRLSLSVN